MRKSHARCEVGENPEITSKDYLSLYKKAIRHVMYNCSVSSRPTVDSKTKEGSIEPGTETLSLAADAREDGLIKARTGADTKETTYKDWYKTVYVPDVTAEAQG